MNYKHIKSYAASAHSNHTESVIAGVNFYILHSVSTLSNTRDL